MVDGIISKIPNRNSKILFVLGSYEYQERLEGNILKKQFEQCSDKVVWSLNVHAKIQILKVIYQIPIHCHS